MNRTELKTLVEAQCIDIAGNNVFDPISAADARSWLQDIFRDQEASDLPQEERIPLDTAPEAFMEVWNSICVDHANIITKYEED